MIEKFFKLKENNTSIKTEVIAGITTFMTMAYILAVNPDILGAAGMDKSAILLATAIHMQCPCVHTQRGHGEESASRQIPYSTAFRFCGQALPIFLRSVRSFGVYNKSIQ